MGLMFALNKPQAVKSVTIRTSTPGFDVGTFVRIGDAGRAGQHPRTRDGPRRRPHDDHPDHRRGTDQPRAGLDQIVAAEPRRRVPGNHLPDLDDGVAPFVSSFSPDPAHCGRVFCISGICCGPSYPASLSPIRSSATGFGDPLRTKLSTELPTTVDGGLHQRFTYHRVH